MIQNVIIGTVKRLKLTIIPQDNAVFNIGEHEGYIHFFCSETVEKVFRLSNFGSNTYKDTYESIDETDNSCVIRLNTADVGCGRLKARVEVYIPEGTSSSGRKEIYDIMTNINIVSGLK